MEKNMFSGLINEFTKLLNQLGFAWWVEVVTDSPHCTYYFGPFISANEAKASQSGYIKDLEQEGAQRILAKVKRCKPEQLTIYEDDLSPFASLASQFR